MTARAVAGFSVPGNTTFCILPLTAVQCDPGDATCYLGCDKVNDPTCAAPDNTFWGECPGIDPHGLQPLEGGGTCDPKKEFCKGCKYTIRAGPAGGPSAGNYNALACAGRGACELRLALAAAGNCQCTASPGIELEVDSEPGVNAGPVKQGLNVRFDQYQCDPLEDPSCADCATNPTDHPPDTNIHQGTEGPAPKKVWSGIDWDQYSANDPFQAPSHTGQANRRVLIIPITPWGEFNDAKDGREKVKPSFFGGFFMTRAVGRGNDGDIRVEYIHDDIVDIIGFDPNGPSPTNIVTPVLYR
jgi:hypothetical protein